MGGTTTAVAGLRAELSGFRKVQRPAYDCAGAVAARLEPGMPFLLDMAPVHRGFTAGIGRSGALGFGTRSLEGPAGDALHGHREGWSPPWSPYRFAGHPPRLGLWAVEPHPGFRGTGARFEEIRVVTDSSDPEESGFWLDDDLPWESPRARSAERGEVRLRTEGT
ncbi:hypothetical protein [Streptomyces tendae]|uniref:hypothetical protein n=1 Tax=Streptomyces tendae TaxID=1932 RepID=UPI0024912108|nr:hypothetical protein [Streptomyces tendae]